MTHSFLVTSGQQNVATCSGRRTYRSAIAPLGHIDRSYAAAVAAAPIVKGALMAGGGWLAEKVVAAKDVIVGKLSNAWNALTHGSTASLTKAEQMVVNATKGRAAEVRAGEILRSWGNEILGSRVYVRTSLGTRIVDHLVRTPAGKILAVEVKSGNALRTATQVIKDIAMATEGGSIFGKNAPYELFEVTRRIPTMVLRIT